MTIDIICGSLSGMSTGRDISEMYGESISNRRNLGHYVAAIRIDAFVDVDEFERQLQELAEEVRTEPRLDEEKPNHIPGDPEKNAKARRKKQGVPIPVHDIERFEEIATKYDIDSLV
jgi:LDH2 family malate/lactate/ureidoglycolate dehydrogenase